MFKAMHIDGLPQVPESITAKIFSGEPYSSGYPQIVQKDGKSWTSGAHRRWLASDELVNWIKKNIVEGWQDLGIGYTEPPCHAPHIDYTRFYVLQYIIESGGDNVATVFYEPAGYKVDITRPRPYINNYDQLNEVYRIVQRPKTWTLLASHSNIHGVENIQSKRYAIQIGFMTNPILIQKNKKGENQK